jgi:hypothetical protein
MGGVEFGVMNRRPAALATALGAALVLPAVALATIVEVGKGGPDATPSCPTRPCVVMARTTGYQAKVGDQRSFSVIPQDGRIVAWTISLGKPGKRQTAYFDKLLGGKSVAQLTILRPRRRLRARVMAQGDPQNLQPYFGQTVQFALKASIPVQKGWLVALTVPTWAPVLAAGLGGDTSWRASRPKGKCDDTAAPTAQTRVHQLAQYYCLYQTARVTYSASLIPDPSPTQPSSPPPPPPPPPPGTGTTPQTR